MNILSIIPARGGSKGLPNKNIKPLCGKPLIAYTIEASLNCESIGRTIVSTDSEEIAAVARKYGAEVPFIRPEVLSGDTATSYDVVMHCLNVLKEMEQYIPDYVCLLQCTSPLRSSSHISEAVELLLAKNAESVVSVCEASQSPYWAKTIDETDKMEDLIKQDTEVLRRQDLPKVYAFNGAIYINSLKVLYGSKALINEKSYPYIMDKKSSVDIDDEIDFMLAELILMKEKLCCTGGKA